MGNAAQASVDRVAISRALQQHGYLSLARRLVPPPIIDLCMANARIARRFSRVFQAFVVLRRALAMQEAINPAARQYFREGHSQLKTDFEVAPVYLKQIRRIQALLCVYFFVLLVEALFERELRQAMEREGIEALPMYPEGRPCRCPTARRLIELFEPIQRHTLVIGKKAPVVMVTELSRRQGRILKLLTLPARDYGR